MADVVFIGIGVAFLIVCVAYVRALDRLVRGAEEQDPSRKVGS